MTFFKWKLIFYLSSLLLSLTILVACNQAYEASIPKPDLESEPALYSSEDLARAKAARIVSVTDLEGKDLNNEEINIDLPDLEENLFEETSNLTTQDTLPTGSGIAAYYRTDGNTYQIWIHNQAIGGKTHIYSSVDEVQSVAVNSSGSLVVASIKNPANGFFDIYVFDDGKPMLNLSNTNDRDELDVSVTADGTKIVWSGPARNGRIKVQICDYDSATQSCAKSTLGNAHAKDQRQPSITSNGKYIALIRDIDGGKRRIFLYDVMNNTYIRVFTGVNEVRYPSASDDGKYVMFLEIEGTERKVKIKNRDTNEIANELTGKSIKKAHMQSSGNYYIFDSFITGHQRVFTANIDTNERARVAAGRWDYGGGFWQHSPFNIEVKLTAFDGTPNDDFGESVAISGDTVIVGAPHDTKTGVYIGSAYIYERNASDKWILAKKILAFDGGGFAGESVAISGDTVVMGGTFNNGVAYVFERNNDVNNNWGGVKKLLASDGALLDYFGGSVAVSEDTVVVGAYDNDDNGTNSGSVYIYDRNFGGSNNWGEVKKILASDGASGDSFGISVAISGDTVVVGAIRDDDNGFWSGSTYIFERNHGGNNNWGEVKKILASDGTPDDWFGWSVAISEDTVVVGARFDDDNGEDSGSAYIYERNHGGNNNWGEVKKILPSDEAVFDQFGSSVAISEDTVVVGALDDDNGYQSGSAYIYKRNFGGNNNWGESKKILASDGAEWNWFGWSVAISRDTVVVGAMANGSGAAYIYE